MIAIDTNVLVYAHRTESPNHDAAVRWLRHLAEGSIPWGLPVFCVGEFLRVVTHRDVFDPPSTVEQATAALDSLITCPTLRILNPGPLFFVMLVETLRTSGATGNLVFDAQIATVCREHGISTLLTEDRDFTRFSSLTVKTLDTPTPASA